MPGQLPRACEQLMQADARVAQADHALNRLDAQAATGFGVAGALVLAGVLAGYFPARKAVKITAIEAMRDE